LGFAVFRVYDQQKAMEGADFVYVKHWISYTDYGKILSQESSWMLTEKHLKHTNNAQVMHCLPVRCNVELSDEILWTAGKAWYRNKQKIACLQRRSF
jgi:ornithine carbamoyltransferase